MIYITSDLHGRMDCLKKLLEHVHFSEDGNNWLYILGDVIDRNDRGGVDILKWLLTAPNVQLILGNHEQMMLSNRWVFEEISKESIDALSGRSIDLLRHWKRNGGDCTMDALSRESAEVRADILEYLEECPLTESVCVGDRDYLLVHGGLGNFAPDKALSDYTESEILWERPRPDTRYDPERYTVILGHTPTAYYGPQYRNRIFKTDSWWNIDTGAAMSGGRPMLLCLDTGMEYYIEEDGTVIER